MKITGVETIKVSVNHRGNWVFIQVNTDEGISGIAEASHSGNDDLLAAEIKKCGKWLKGKDPQQINSLYRQLLNTSRGRIHQTALGALETACWDILGKTLGKPIAALLGGPIIEKLPLYANINRFVRDRTPRGFADAAAQAEKEGFKALKLAPFDEVSGLSKISSSRTDWRLGIERVKAVRQAVGAEIEVGVDCHRRFDYASFLPVLDELDMLDLFWVEEPVPNHHLSDIRKIATRSHKPLAGGERLFSLEEFEGFLTERRYDVLMPDLKHVGGIRELKNIGEACRLCGLRFSPHNPAGPLATAASAQVAASVPSFWHLEYAWGEVNWRARLLDPPEEIVDGMLILSDNPGVGHTLNPKFIESHRI